MRLESIFGIIGVLVYFIVDLMLLPIHLVMTILGITLIPVFWAIEKVFKGVRITGYNVRMKELFFANSRYFWREEVKR